MRATYDCLTCTAGAVRGPNNWSLFCAFHLPSVADHGRWDLGKVRTRDFGGISLRGSNPLVIKKSFISFPFHSFDSVLACRAKTENGFRC